MKKYLLGLLLFSISLLGYSEVSEDVKKAKDVTTEITNQIVSKEPNATVVYMTEKLQQFVESLKVPAEKVFSILVAKQKIDAYTILIFLILGILSLLIAFSQFKHAQWGTGTSFYDSDDKESRYWKGYLWNNHTTIFLICIIFGGISTLASLILLPEMLSGFLNPEYGAIKEIMELF